MPAATSFVKVTIMRTIALVLVMLVCCAAYAQPRSESSKASAAASGGSHARHKHSTRQHVGKASVYSRKFDGRTTADGSQFNAESNSAASKTLPLGTTARVKNLKNGKSTVVKIKDRGPYVKGRVVDVSPKTARDLGMDEKHGVAPVEVTALHVPGKDNAERDADKTASTSKRGD
jgi:rare lipoprotein A